MNDPNTNIYGRISDVAVQRTLVAWTEKFTICTSTRFSRGDAGHVLSAVAAAAVPASGDDEKPTGAGGSRLR
jgi:hypothetical protein